MKYDFDTIINRDNEPNSYSVKWVSTGTVAEMVKRFAGISDIPKDRLVFFTADMDYKCAPELVEAMRKTAEHGIYGYSMPPEAYYEAICKWFRERFDWNFSAKNIIVGTDGTHKLLEDCIKAFTQPGDGVIVLLPSYNYHNDIEPIGRVMVGVQLKNDNGYYTVDYAALEMACAAKRNTLMLMMQPHNPTGRVFTEEELLKIGDICRRYGVYIVSDEVHIDIARKGQKVIPVMKALGTRGVATATAINKTFNTAGLAMSNLIVEDPYMMAKLDRGFGMASPFGISAVISAYTECGPWVDALNAYLDKIIDYTVERFKKDLPKVTFVKPEGTYILWLDFSGYGFSDDVLDEKINRTHVLINDGQMFDAINPKQYRRFCLTAPMAQVEDMCNRLAAEFKDC